ncbi:Adenine DNA glycosylase [Planctomycetales bacterium 10988]|nr:Adenine DNA glycosylase [Planctomycetales bacterium 10988]
MSSSSPLVYCFLKVETTFMPDLPTIDRQQLPFGIPDAAWKRKLRRQLLRWYAEHQRDLPWRKRRDPYAIWISEMMLQQTQVATVIPYFQRFLETFPTIQALAEAPEEQVLREWEGLGYYRRARNLHAAAKKIQSDHGGIFPQTFDEVQALPGIGRYTAGAILSIAFDLRLPILEANTIRLFSRLIGYRGDPRSLLGTKLLWYVAEDWLPRKEVGHFNQALMELGSLICTPKEPKCPQCPAQKICIAKQEGWQQEIPQPAAKTVYEEVQEVAIILRKEDEVLLFKQEEAGRWAGMWDFCRFPWSGEVPQKNTLPGFAPSYENFEKALNKKLYELQDFTIKKIQYFNTLKHGVTRFRITLECFTAEPNDLDFLQRINSLRKNRQWVKIKDLNDFPLNVTARKIAKQLQNS